MSRPSTHRRLRILAEAAVFAVAVALAACGSPATALHPEAPATPGEIRTYRASGQWERDTTSAVDAARARIADRLADGVRRPAIVLDVDDTSLSSYDCLDAVEFDRAAGRGCARRAEMPAIAQTLSLYRYARGQHVTVLFLTGRREHLRRATVANLRAAGYTGRLRLRMRPNRERPGTHDGFKARQRRRFQRQGFTIVANVGDQHSDLTGGVAERTFKLPNPMYVIPEA
jgi:predicted secreted acid phosphatase